MLLDGRQPVDTVVVGVALVVLGDQAWSISEAQFLQGKHSDVPVQQQLLANALFCPATEQHPVRQDDGHHALFFEEVETVQ